LRFDRQSQVSETGRALVCSRRAESCLAKSNTDLGQLSANAVNTCPSNVTGVNRFSSVS
jgi:hypothetical protein